MRRAFVGDSWVSCLYLEYFLKVGYTQRWADRRQTLLLLIDIADLWCFVISCLSCSDHIMWRQQLNHSWITYRWIYHLDAASPSMDHEHGTVCQPILEHQIRPSAPSSVISRPTCFSSCLRCCWQVGSAPFVRRRCDCLASSAPFTNIQTYLLLTYLIRIQKTD